MVFILDKGINDVFLNAADGSHAMYDQICFEYRLGLNFTPAEFDNFTKGAHSLAGNEDRWPSGDALDKLSQLTQRWCFPSRMFILRVLYTLTNILEFFIDMATRDIQQKGNESGFVKTLWNIDDSRHAQIWNELFNCIDANYINKGATEEDWSNNGQWKQWFDHHTKEKLSWQGGEELLDPQVVLQHFGWHENKQMNDKDKPSTCHIFMKYIRAFVNLSIIDNIPEALNGAFAKEVRKIAEQHGSQKGSTGPHVYNFSMPACWTTAWKEHRRLHNVNGTDRIKPLLNLSHAFSPDAKVIGLVAEFNRGEDFGLEAFVQGLWISGYQSEVIHAALTRWKNFAMKHRIINSPGLENGPHLIRWMEQVIRKANFLDDST